MSQIKNFVPILIAIILISCNGRDALQFNQNIVKIQKEILSRTDSMNDIPRDSVAKWNSYTIYLNARASDLKAVKAPDGGEEFKEAMVNDIYGLLETIDLKSKMYQVRDQPAEYDKLNRQYEALLKKIENLDNAVELEQTKFAKANHFRLEQ